ncbi:MAG: hypothetical protein K0M64_04270 [Rhizobium sp.]|nr:hypothetical protein [Rhizobium sp.]
MAVDRLTSTSALIAAVRASATAKSGQSRRAAEPAPTVGADKPVNRPASGRPSVAALRRELAELVRDANIQDPEVVDRLRPRVVRSILLWEFGASLREHPEWQPMLETVVSALAANEGQRAQFQQLLAELRSPG